MLASLADGGVIGGVEFADFLLCWGSLGFWGLLLEPKFTVLEFAAGNLRLRQTVDTVVKLGLLLDLWPSDSFRVDVLI